MSDAKQRQEVKKSYSPQATDKPERVLREEEVLKFWDEQKIFEKTLEKNRKGSLNAGASGKDFVFYEGPPTANGRPLVPTASCILL